MRCEEGQDLKSRLPYVGINTGPNVKENRSENRYCTISVES